MPLPQMNPLAAKLMGGVDFRKQLQDQLLEAAGRTDDPAYRQRLIEVANGKRPLRTLLHDPAFLAEKGMSAPGAEEAVDQMQAEAEHPHGTPDELRERMKAQVEEMGMAIPSLEEAQALFPEVMELQRETEAVVRAEELTGWGGSAEQDENPEK